MHSIALFEATVKLGGNEAIVAIFIGAALTILACGMGIKALKNALK